LQVGFEIARFLFARPSGAQPGIGLQSLAVGDPSRQHATDETLDPASNFAGRGFAAVVGLPARRRRLCLRVVDRCGRPSLAPELQVSAAFPRAVPVRSGPLAAFGAPGGACAIERRRHRLDRASAGADAREP
jgi:hypothetical protein